MFFLHYDDNPKPLSEWTKERRQAAVGEGCTEIQKRLPDDSLLFLVLGSTKDGFLSWSASPLFRGDGGENLLRMLQAIIEDIHAGGIPG